MRTGNLLKSMKVVVLGLIGTAALAHGALAQEGCRKLTVHHFLPPKATIQAKLIEPWTERVTKASGGCLTFEIYPSMTLGGRPPQLYGQVRDGVADIAWTVAGYTPGAFPALEVFELPTVHRNDARATNLAIQDMYDEFLADELSDVHPLLVHTGAGLMPFTKGVKIDKLADFKGLRLRSPNRTGAWLIEALGASPVNMPVPEFPSAISKSVIDGGFINFEVSLPLKGHELTDQVTYGDGDLTFGTLVFLLVMNKDTYESLPQDMRDVLDANSGPAIAKWAGEVYNEAEKPGRELFEATEGNRVVNLSAEETEKLTSVAEKAVVQRWIKDVSARGVDGAKLVERARAAVAAHSEK